MRVDNCDIAKQLEATTLGARLWRLKPGQASTRHRHRTTTELYLLLEGTGRLHVADELLTLTPLGSVLVEAEYHSPALQRHRQRPAVARRRRTTRARETLEMTAKELAWIYPDRPKALPEQRP